MRKEDVEILRMFQFQLSFLEDGGYRRSIRAPWRGSLIFEDSPTCIHFHAPTCQHPCSECRLIASLLVAQADRANETKLNVARALKCCCLRERYGNDREI